MPAIPVSLAGGADTGLVRNRSTIERTGSDIPDRTIRSPDRYFPLMGRQECDRSSDFAPGILRGQLDMLREEEFPYLFSIPFADIEVGTEIFKHARPPGHLRND